MLKAVLVPCIASAAALCFPQSAQAQDSDCRGRDDRGRDRCAPAAQERQRAAYGVPAIEDLASRNVRTMRAFFVDGYGQEAGLVTFTRAPGEEPQVEVRFVRSPGGGAVRSTLSSVVHLATWDELVADGRNFDQTFAPKPGGHLAICLHAWVVTVEAADARGQVRRTTEDACEEGPAIRHAFELAAAAVKAVPACAVLDPQKSRNNVTSLQECTMLEGDRAAAALALNAFRSTWFPNPRGPDFARALEYLFFEQVEFAWPGEPPVTGSQAASEIWAARASEQRFYPSRIFGETADRVRIEGVIELDRGSSERAPTRVPAVMLWTRENGFDFRMRSLISEEPSP